MPPTIEQPGLAWRELCEDPRFAFLDDLPFKVETNRWGQIVMSPTRFRHGLFQTRIARLLQELAEAPGEAATEIAIATSEGVKVADVIWCSAERLAVIEEEFAASVAPEVCVEVLSPWNAWGEIEQKIRLYLAAGAEEVWVCDLEGRMRFFDAERERERSGFVAAFPARIES